MRIKLRIQVSFWVEKFKEDYAIYQELAAAGMALPETVALRHEVLEMSVTVKKDFTPDMEESVKAVFLRRFSNVNDIQIQIA